MKVGVIRTAKQHRAALAEVRRLMQRNPKRRSAAADRLELLAVLVQDYETRVLPEPRADPVAAIKFRMEQQGLRQRDLVPYIGSRSHVSEVLNRKRPLSLAMIRALHHGLGIPAEALLGSS